MTGEYCNNRSLLGVVMLGSEGAEKREGAIAWAAGWLWLAVQRVMYMSWSWLISSVSERYWNCVLGIRLFLTKSVLSSASEGWGEVVGWSAARARVFIVLGVSPVALPQRSPARQRGCRRRTWERPAYPRFFPGRPSLLERVGELLQRPAAGQSMNKLGPSRDANCSPPGLYLCATAFPGAPMMPVCLCSVRAAAPPSNCRVQLSV
jgi:hypothetical protein